MGFRSPFFVLCRHKGTATLLVVEIAIGFVLLCLAWQAGVGYQARIAVPSGIADAELLAFYPLVKGASPIDPDELVNRLREIPGVREATLSNQAPYGPNAWSSAVSSHPKMDKEHLVANVYFDSGSLAQTLGLRLSQGRLFQPTEYTMIPASPTHMVHKELPALVTTGLAHRLYPDGSALDRPIYGMPQRLRIVGVIERLPQPKASHGRAMESATFVLPLKPTDAASWFLMVRADAHRRTEVAASVQAYLARLFPERAVTKAVTLEQLRHTYFQDDRRWAWTIAACAAGWWLLTLLSIAVAGNLWVQHSALRISLHRAVGATQRQIVRVVRLENLLLAGGGIALGWLLFPFAIDRMPMPWTAEPMPAYWQALAVLAIGLFTQLAVTWPARRAARVSPYRVTRKPVRL
ncbi:ABC transporter permease [Pseudoxanthomonas sp. UTMC 1351]|uniref:ABC transporter permease n=1 Tax=Pseudoxanthomonas sp. UTMC 1351 TaxID=2695853 RepID=UPI0034CEF679